MKAIDCKYDQDGYQLSPEAQGHLVAYAKQFCKDIVTSGKGHSPEWWKCCRIEIDDMGQPVFMWGGNRADCNITGDSDFEIVFVGRTPTP